MNHPFGYSYSSKRPLGEGKVPNGVSLVVRMCVCVCVCVCVRVLCVALLLLLLYSFGSFYLSSAKLACGLSLCNFHGYDLLLVFVCSV